MFVPIALLLVCSLAVISAKGFDKNLDDLWMSYKEKYNKQFASVTEDEYRRYQWEENVANIQQHNLQYDMGQHSFTLGINEYSDLNPKEYSKYLHGFWPKKANSTKLWDSIKAKYEKETLPDTVDWRDQGYVTPIKNQGQCGSCWAFSTTGSLEGQNFRSSGKLVSLSEQNLVDCVKENGGCSGGWMDTAFDYVQNNGGIDTELCYPYTAKDGTCAYSSSCIGGYCHGHVDITKGSEADLKTAVATQGPVSVAIDASQQSFGQYRGGVYLELKCSSTQADHAVLVVGYGTDGGQDYWLVKNSWGTSWGMQGYIKMARNQNNMCAIATYSSYPVV